MSQPDDGRRGAPPGQWPPPAYGPPPGHPPPAYGPPGYGAFPGYGPPPGSWRRSTNTLAAIAVALCFVFPPAALVTGLVARRQIERTGEEGAGLALGAIIVGGISTALFAVGLVLWLGAVASLTSTSFGP